MKQISSKLGTVNSKKECEVIMIKANILDRNYHFAHLYKKLKLLYTV